MINFINSFLEGISSPFSTSKNLARDLLQLKNIRKGSRLSRMGRLVTKKFQASFLAGLMIVSLSLGGLNNFSVFANRPVEAAENQLTAIEEPTNIATHTESTTQLPLGAGTFRLTQRFSVFHPAVDLAASIGTAIKPIAAGKVAIVSQNNFGLGNYIIIKHGSEFYSVYAHLNEIEVEKDQEVTKDTIIGTVGNTGFSTGPHLHLEIIVEDQKVNPLSILPPL